MKEYRHLLDTFAAQCVEILGDSLTGVYLHGSAAMGCFHWESSDLDLLVVIGETDSDRWKRPFLDMAAELNGRAPAKGLELSVVREDVCRPFVYPTPFELHFSPAHLDRYQTDPEEYIGRMRGTDKDLAAHFTMIYHRGKVLCGKAIPEVFAPVPEACYWDSVLFDLEDAEAAAADRPVYVVLNLCRTLAYRTERLLLSKREGGEWGLAHLPAKYGNLISDALTAYRDGGRMELDGPSAREFAGDMLARIGGRGAGIHMAGR